jgi:hypothetical protein
MKAAEQLTERLRLHCPAAHHKRGLYSCKIVGLSKSIYALITFIGCYHYQRTYITRGKRTLQK